MATLPETRPAAKAFYATLHGLSGVLVKPADAVLFLEPENGAVISLSAEEVLRDVVVNGEVGSSMSQYLADMAAGGYAAVCTSREEGRA
jgi:hypothetical protein